MFEKRRLRKMQKALEKERETWNSLGDISVFFQDPYTLSVEEEWADGLANDDLDWLGTYAGVAYVSKMMFNLIGTPEAETLWDAVRSGSVLAANQDYGVVDDDDDADFLGAFEARVYTKPDGDRPFLQTPVVADGGEGILTLHAVPAVLRILSSRSDEQAARIKRGLELLVEHYIDDTYDPDDVQSMSLIPYVVMEELAEEGLLTYQLD